MPLSRYVKIYRIPETPNKVTLFSTLATEAVDVASTVLQDIEKGTLSKKEKNRLTGLGLLVKSCKEERQDLLGFIEYVNALSRKFTAIVALNLDCNLGCTYCFEGKRKGKYYMSEETADAFIDFVKSRVSQKREIDIQFYGGEPLLSVSTIERISKGIKAIAKKKKVEFSFSLITNGTLLTPRVVETLKPLGLRSASITLDGPKKVHDTFRAFKTGIGSFDTIFKNIKNAHSLIDVHVGGNYTQSHYKEFPRLLDYLIENGIGPDKIASIKFDPVFQESREFAPSGFRDGCMTVNEPWLFKAGLFLREETLKRGFSTQPVGSAVCAVERRDDIVVNYDGSLYKCPGFIGRKKFCVGTVQTGILDYRSSHNLDNWKTKKCLACVYLPLCFGGCRYMKVLRSGNIRGVDCKKEFFDKTLEAFVRQDVKYS